MGKKTEEFKKARISSIAAIRAELIEDKTNVQKLVELQKMSLENFTAKTQQALADFTANTQIVLSQCDAVTKTIDAKIEALEKEMELIRTEQLTEKHFEGEYNTLKEQVEGMYASVRMFQKPMEESHEEESTTGNTSVETGKEEKETSVEETVTPETTAEEIVTSETTMEETAASEPVAEEAQITEEIDTSSITEPEEDIMIEPAPEYITEETFTVKETVTDEVAETAETINDEEFDSMYDDIIDTETETPAESTSNTTIQVVESSVTPPTEQTAEQSNAPASIAELLNRASKINI